MERTAYEDPHPEVERAYSRAPAREAGRGGPPHQVTLSKGPLLRLLSYCKEGRLRKRQLARPHSKNWRDTRLVQENFKPSNPKRDPPYYAELPQSLGISQLGNCDNHYNRMGRSNRLVTAAK